VIITDSKGPFGVKDTKSALHITQKKVLFTWHSTFKLAHCALSITSRL